MKRIMEAVAFGGGCFWCQEAVFLELKGVLSVTSGYAGGPSMVRPDSPQASSGQAPTYEEVSAGGTGHAEVIRIEYDPSVITFRKLLEVFFTAHDPTTPNRQGADIGTQYRSIILYSTEDQRREAEATIQELTESKKFEKLIVTELKLLDAFYPGEEYHQNYFERNSDEPYSEAVIKPKLEKVQKTFAELLKNSPKDHA